MREKVNETRETIVGKQNKAKRPGRVKEKTRNPISAKIKRSLEDMVAIVKQRTEKTFLPGTPSKGKSMWG